MISRVYRIKSLNFLINQTPSLLFSFTRHLGLDLVPRKEFEMVDPDQISVSELYKLVCCFVFFVWQTDAVLTHPASC